MHSLHKNKTLLSKDQQLACTINLFYKQKRAEKNDKTRSQLFNSLMINETSPYYLLKLCHRQYYNACLMLCAFVCVKMLRRTEQ